MMIKLIGVVIYKQNDVDRVKLVSILENQQTDAIVLNFPNVINRGFLVVTLKNEYGVSPEEIKIPLHIEGSLPIQR